VKKERGPWFPSAAALSGLHTELLGSQEFFCELTNLPLERMEVNGDPAMFASLDRIGRKRARCTRQSSWLSARFGKLLEGASDNVNFDALIELFGQFLRAFVWIATARMSAMRAFYRSISTAR